MKNILDRPIPLDLRQSLLHLLQSHTVLITTTGKAPLTLTLRPITVLLGLTLSLGGLGLWIGWLTYRNSQLAQRTQLLTDTASQVLSDLDQIGSEVEALKSRAGLSSQSLDQDQGANPALLPPQGGVSRTVTPEVIFALGQRKISGLDGILRDRIKPSLEATLRSEAKRLAAFPNGKPLAGKLEISSEFGLRPSPFETGNYEIHEGMDLAGPVGEPVLATADGMIVEASYDNGYGYHVKIKHDPSYTTLYGHLSQLSVTSGRRINRGDVVGYLGSTGRSSGPHLHYGIYRKGEAVNPRYYLKLDSTP
ncbi:MAG: M23 family metallopeptidase [Nodosilinea sp.]